MKKQNQKTAKYNASVPASAVNKKIYADRRFTAFYLQSVLEENDLPLFLMALRAVADAHGGIAEVAMKAGIRRTHLYEILSPEGNPSLPKLEAILRAMGYQIQIAPVKVKAA